MASAVPSIPPLDKISVIGIWIETALWGICIIFSGVLYVLLKRSGTHMSRMMLGGTSTLLFCLCTAHIALSLRQLLEAFVYIPSPTPPLYSILYWADETNPVAIAKTVMYDTSVWLQDIILIWRMYVVWGRNWKICVLPFVVDLAHMGVAYTATVLISKPDADIYANTLARIGPVGWSLDLAVNVTVTAAIAGRLLWMGSKVASISSRGMGPQNRYLTSVFTIVESGALFAAVTLVMLVLYLVHSPVALTGIDISVQLAVLTPLLIIVRVGLGLTHSLPKAYETYLANTTYSQGTYGQSSTFYAAPGEGIQISINRERAGTGDRSFTETDTREYALHDLKAAETASKRSGDDDKLVAHVV
ncbi:hypothetical protein FA95DRAFT_1565321 [Auriscalpium vulgare]|uniref:Uncharacterized protein n=1 Tax=Auriscalpium vulgare TaxID=40419 RepID=A0ACB8RD29_9AGAM|nr:hypothetical protein FA95DRAFT_1565321 [Auriscalpium vulgare]